MSRETIQTDAAPAAIGTYSQAVATRANQTVYVSGQIPLDPDSMQLVGHDFAEQALHVIQR